MLFDIDDVNNLFAKKVHCFGLATTTVVAAGVAAPSIFGAGVTALAANMALLSVVGTAFSVAGALQGGQQAANQAQFQAQVAQNNAIIAEQQRDRAIKTAASQEEDFRRQQSALFGSRRALLGDTGIIGGAGSPLAVSTDFQGETELNALRLRNQGSVEANRLQQSVLNQQAQAGLFGAQARSERTTGFLRAGGELFSGVGRARKAFKG